MKKEKITLFLKKRKKLISAFLICLVLLASAPFLINAYVVSYSEKYILTAGQAEALDADCIIVPGALVYGEALSPLLEDRVITGLSLYKNGAAGRLLMSGDHGHKGYDEVNAMKAYAVDAGVQSDNVFMDHAGFSTYESMYRAKEVFKADKVIISTQGYHLYRAVYIARQLGLDAYGVASDNREYSSKTELYNNSREFLARVKDFFTVIVKPSPTYLGEAIPISGSGALTDDRV
ncbi:MAG: DUF218 domain-containing protein [Clostridiales bacterium]|nr:DUF218 domain-containing protein [Clostridiales bacterium]